MSLRRIIAAVITLIALTQLTAEASPYPELKKLYYEKQYFQLRDALQSYKNDSSTELLFYRGVVSNKFNQLRPSIKYLQDYLRKAGAGKDAPL